MNPRSLLGIPVFETGALGRAMLPLRSGKKYIRLGGDRLLHALRGGYAHQSEAVS